MKGYLKVPVNSRHWHSNHFLRRIGIRICTASSLSFAILFLVVCATAFAGVPQFVDIQGKLTDGTGIPVPSGDYLIQFRIYDNSIGGNELWSSAGYVLVPVEDGLFVYLLGSTDPLPDSLAQFDSLWLGMTLNGEAEMSPRIRLASVAYALRAGMADYADTAAYAHAAGGGTGSKWSVADSILYTNGYWGLSRGSVGNMFYGDSLHTMVNFGVACTVGRDMSPGGKDWEHSTISGGSHHSSLGSYDVIAGGKHNTTGSLGAVVGGGEDNVAANGWCVVSGGQDNNAQGGWSAVGGGRVNWAFGDYSTIGGGRENYTMGPRHYSTVGGGHRNAALGQASTVAGGDMDTVTAHYGGIASGRVNSAGDADADTAAFVGGGSYNRARAMFSTIGGGLNNEVGGAYSLIAGGSQNVVNGSYSAILGGHRDTITASASYSYLFGIDSKLTEDSTFMVDMPHIHFGDENDGYEFPTADGSNGQVMATDGNGGLNWTSMTAASGWTDDGTTFGLRTPLIGWASAPQRQDPGFMC